MRVLVTGATGFVGSHTVAALLAAGHGVRLFVRDAKKVARVFEPFGAEVAAGAARDVATGDVTDLAAVEAALEGCDAVVHAAAVVATNRSQAPLALATNAKGAEHVVGTAVRRGLDPIVYVSSIEALDDGGQGVLGPYSEPSPGGATAYSRSKAEAERYARLVQAGGAPVVIVYPGGIWGPFDPGLSEAVRGALFMLQFRVAPRTRGGMPVVDVRDVAAVHAAAMKPGLGPRRFMAGGHFLSLAEFAGIVTRLTGLRILPVPVPGPLLRQVGRAGDAIRLAGVDHPITHDAMSILTNLVPCDDTATTRELGVRFRDPEDSIGDTLRWLYQAGRIGPRLAGRLAS